jgi:hypothetical protein
MKCILIFLSLLITSSVFSQKIYHFNKIGTPSIKVKVEGMFTIIDNNLTMVSTYKEKKSEYTLKIISKDENDISSTYKCEGTIGVSDKHQFIFVFSKKMVIWTGYNSFDNSKVEQFITLSEPPTSN